MLEAGVNFFWQLNDDTVYPLNNTKENYQEKLPEKFQDGGNKDDENIAISCCWLPSYK